LSLVSHIRARVYAHRARWSARQIMPHLKATDRVLDVGAGDCRLAARLHEKVGCAVVPVDVEDFNQTELKLTLFDGQRLPFEDQSFDAVLLVFVLHHAEDAAAVLAEARRVSRSRIIVLEDVTTSWWDRMMFRGFHRWLAWSEKISYPHHEYRPAEWTRLARSLGLKERETRIAGRTLGPLSCRHIAFAWEKAEGAGTNS
jgi:ubiquinone/menaquinone biosynthesis C-methylase UbiE